MKRRIVALLVALVLVTSMICPAYAAEERGSTVVSAYLSLYAAPGHAYIVFTNVSNSTIYIGGYAVESDETITIGTFSNQTNYVCINYELLNINAYKSAKVVSMDILIQDLDYAISAINSVISTHSVYDANTNNCTHFAMRIWNAVAPSNAYISYTFVPQLGTTTNYSNFCNVLQSLSGYYVYGVTYPTWQSVSGTHRISLV